MNQYYVALGLLFIFAVCSACSFLAGLHIGLAILYGPRLFRKFRKPPESTEEPYPRTWE